MRRALGPRRLLLLLVVALVGGAAWLLTREDGLPPPGEPALSEADVMSFLEAKRDKD